MIRDARSHDLDSLVHLMTELGYPTTKEDMGLRMDVINEQTNYKTIVYEHEGKVVGLAGMFKAYRYESNQSYVRIVTMIVDERYRSMGIGKALLKAAEEWAEECGATAVNLNSGNRAERQDAHEFYQRNGYVAKATGFYKSL